MFWKVCFVFINKTNKLKLKNTSSIAKLLMPRTWCLGGVLRNLISSKSVGSRFRLEIGLNFDRRGNFSFIYFFIHSPSGITTCGWIRLAAVASRLLGSTLLVKIYLNLDHFQKMLFNCSFFSWSHSFHYFSWWIA